MARAADPPSSTILLNGPWALQSSCAMKAGGAEISATGFETQGWHRTEVPSTVVAALVADKTYPDPYFGMNLRSFSGVNYRIGAMFSNLAMPDDSPFRCSWWYRAEFKIPPGYKEKTAWLHFDGINYRANVWLNGKQLADAKDMVGTFRAFEFDVSNLIERSRANALAVEVFAPEKDSLALTWVDWNPAPPDKDMGLWKDVYLTGSGPVTLRHPFVSSKLGEDYKTADLTVSADVHNASDRTVDGVLNAEIGPIRLSQPVQLAASETKKIRFEPGQYSQLKLQSPNLWWPYQMGAQDLYTARLEFQSGGQASDAITVQFGIREVTSEMTSTGARLFRINGKKILILGAAWTPDMLLRWSAQKAEAELRYVKDMGLNTIRLEGKMERDEFFDMADRMGILIMPGWCCCDFWERWRQWQPEHHKIAGASLEHELQRLRNHPSVFVWLNASDGPPPANVERMYLDIIKDQEWPNPTISSAAADSTTVTGPSGVKMPGPYDYEPPNYWLVDKEAGGAYGFNTETSPGPAIPPLESLKRFLPADHLWPIDSVWNYHAGGERFMTMSVYLKGMEGRYGKAENLEDFLRKSQAMAYEGQRAMFEAYARNKYTSTGVIQWMLNNAWPSLIWHLYDFYLVPAGGYFGTKKACEPVHVQYSYDDNSVAVVNSKYEPLAGITAAAKIYSLDGAEKYSHDVKLEVPADGSVKAFDLPAPDQWGTTYFLQLSLHDAAGKRVSDNFYWLSTKPDTLDWKKRRGTAYTPQKDYGDVTALNQLPAVKLVLHETVKHHGNSGSMRVTLRNPGKEVAFMVHLRLTRGKGGEDVAPVFWDDNYVTLLPGEHRELTATYEASALAGTAPVVEVDGWNVGSTQR
ncbi:MAG: beta galactosidase jelly roll domain-containing protein [Acidobacteriia bacterium]|nr:beta galactosidase jelly roll domain-containing protein [Terriglobia bacterium]